MGAIPHPRVMASLTAPWLALGAVVPPSGVRGWEATYPGPLPYRPGRSADAGPEARYAAHHPLSGAEVAADILPLWRPMETLPGRAPVQVTDHRPRRDDLEIGTSVTLGPLDEPSIQALTGCAWITRERTGEHRIYVLLDDLGASHSGE